MRVLSAPFLIGFATLATVAGQTTNPIPARIQPTPSSAEIEDFAVIPGSRARVNCLTTAPDGRIFANTQQGQLLLISADGTSVADYLTLWVYAGTQVLSTSEQGFQSFAFHPQFNSPGTLGYGKLYTAHTTSDNWPRADFIPDRGTGDAGDNVILEWQTNNPALSTFQPINPDRPYREILRIQAPFSNHSMGLIAFNPNATPGGSDYGLLYIAVGDGGYSGDPYYLAQRPDNPYGSILRINPLGTNSANRRYGIPATNPFVGSGTGALGEVFAYGLRNPQRFVWDSAGLGQMLIADIGQNAVEEINLGLPGANYGWRPREGSFVFEGEGVGANVRHDSAATGYTYPIAEYDHSEGSAITVGPVVRNGRIPALEGKLLFSDFPTGRIFLIDADNLPSGGSSAITELRLQFQGEERTFLSLIQQNNPSATRADLRFGTDREGRIFLFNKHDNVIRTLIRQPLPPAEPGAIERLAIEFAGKKLRKTSRTSVKIRGTATSAPGATISRIELKVPGVTRGFVRANGTTRWSKRIALRPGRNLIRIRAVDSDGQTSPTARITYLRFTP